MRELCFYVTLSHEHYEDVRELSFFITLCAHNRGSEESFEFGVYY